jgi:hypothetical protein
MENLLWLLPLLACPVAMVVMMLLMGEGMGMARNTEKESSRSVEDLRLEQQSLSEQIESLERRERERV